MVSCWNYGWVIEEKGRGGGADLVGPVGGVAHHAVEEGPDGTEDGGGRAEGGLGEGVV